MDIPTALSVVALAALIHASFQLSVSMVTALSSHARGRRLSGGKVLRMAGAFLAGSVTMTLLILSLMGYLASGFHDQLTTATAWSVVSALLVGVGLVIWLTYYRRGDGTSLLISRGFAHFLHQRISRTTLATEAYSLGLVSVITEGVFIAIPALAAAMALAVLPFGWQLVGIALYTMVASLSIFTVTVLIGSGHPLSRIQRWRERNKRFLQFSAGTGLLVLGFYLYASQVAEIAAKAASL